MSKKSKHKKGRQNLEFFVLRLFLCLVRFSPGFLRAGYANLLVSIFIRFSRRHHRLVARNLDIAFPNMTKQEKARLQNRTYHHYARIIVETAALICRKNPGAAMGTPEIRNLKALQAALEKKRGAIVFSAHFGNWELIPFALYQALGKKIVSVARPMENNRIDPLIRGFREKIGSRILDKTGAMRKIIRALEKNEIVFMLIDQNTIEREGILVNFFNYPARAVTSAARLHLKRDVPLVPLFIHYEKDKTVLEIHEEVHFEPRVLNDRNISTLTQTCTTEIEQAIRRFPEQWFWFHNRWKATLQGEKP